MASDMDSLAIIFIKNEIISDVINSNIYISIIQ